MDTDEDGRISVHEALLLLFKNLHSLLDLAGAVALAAMLAARLACDGAAERVALALGSACLFGNLLNVLMPFKFVGCLVITLLNIIVGDVCRFFCVFCSLQLGFACALYILFRGAGGGGDVLFFGGDLGSVVLRLVWVSLGDNMGEFMAEYPNSVAPGLALALYVAWVVLSAVLLLNLLIGDRDCVQPIRRAGMKGTGVCMCVCGGGDTAVPLHLHRSWQGRKGTQSMRPGAAEGQSGGLY